MSKCYALVGIPYSNIRYTLLSIPKLVDLHMSFVVRLSYHHYERSKGMATLTEERRRYIDAWQKENTKRVLVKLNKRTDADIIEVLEKQDSMQGYIKKAIRAYMK